MPVWLCLSAILSGAVGAGMAVLAGWPWYLAALLYPAVGSLGGFAAGLVLYLCRGRHAPDSAEEAR